MKLTITIDMDNDAFDDGGGGCFECARILEELSFDMKNGNAFGPLMDINGNQVGRAVLQRRPRTPNRAR